MTRFEELQTLPRTPSLLGADFVRVMQEQITEWTAVARQYNIVVT
jgi:hypothetical protein